MIRKLLGREAKIDAQSISVIGRFDRKARLPGHGDRAAKAKAIASSQGYDLLVFVKDVDRLGGEKRSDRERTQKLAAMRAEIDDGFAAVADPVACVRATPCRMIEAWALGDVVAVKKASGARRKVVPVPAKPEELWGDPDDPKSKHPWNVLTRVLGQKPNARTFEDIALESDPRTLCASCPASFKPFEEALKKALPNSDSANVMNAPTTRRERRQSK